MRPASLRGLIGKMVKDVGTERVRPRSYSREQSTVMNWISFTDGTIIYFSAEETECDPIVTVGGTGPRGGEL